MVRVNRLKFLGICVLVVQHSSIVAIMLSPFTDGNSYVNHPLCLSSQRKPNPTSLLTNFRPE